jgi:hypothetical protein
MCRQTRRRQRARVTYSTSWCALPAALVHLLTPARRFSPRNAAAIAAAAAGEGGASPTPAAAAAMQQPMSMAQRLKAKGVGGQHEQEQEDAHEFFHFMVDLAHEELVQVRALAPTPRSMYVAPALSACCTRAHARTSALLLSTCAACICAPLCCAAAPGARACATASSATGHH